MNDNESSIFENDCTSPCFRSCFTEMNRGCCRSSHCIQNQIPHHIFTAQDLTFQSFAPPAKACLSHGNQSNSTTLSLHITKVNSGRWRKKSAFSPSLKYKTLPLIYLCYMPRRQQRPLRRFAKVKSENIATMIMFCCVSQKLTAAVTPFHGR